MEDVERGQGRIQIEQTNSSGFFGRGESVTFLISFWHHQIDRGSLAIAEGSQGWDSAREIGQKVERNRISSEGKCSDCPKYFHFVCRAKDLVDVAKEIIKTHETYEDPKKWDEYRARKKAARAR